MVSVTVWLAFVAGLLSFISPCVLPLIPAYVGYMSNRVTAQAVAGTRSVVPIGARFQMALHGLAFIAGFMVVFVVFGVIITAGTRVLSGMFYDLQREVIPRVGGILIILFGLHFIGLIVPVLHWLECRPLLDRLGQPGLTIKRGLGWTQSVLYADTRPQMNATRNYGLVGSSLMGVVFAAGWTPCIGPIYGSILTMAANSTGTLPQVGGLLVMYSLGLGVPFFLTAIALDRLQGILKRLKRHLNRIKVASGVFMIVIGLLVYTGDLQRISQLGAANSAFSFRLEKCTVDFLNGDLPLSQVRDCLSTPQQ